MPPVEIRPYTIWRPTYATIFSTTSQPRSRAWIEDSASIITQQVKGLLSRHNCQVWQNNDQGGRFHSLRIRTSQQSVGTKKIDFTREATV